MRYDEVCRFQMEVREVAKKYLAIGLEGDELVNASHEVLTRLRDGRADDSAEEHKAIAEAYEKHYAERKRT